MNLIDTHAHLTWDPLYERVDEVIKSAKLAGVNKIISIACDLESAKKVSLLSERYDNIYFAAGIHPSEVKADLNWDLFEEFIKHPNCKAVGECGLDYHYPNIDVALQKSSFKKQMEIAKKYNKPAVIHSRDAADDTYEILSLFPGVNFVIHCYSEDLEFANKILKLGGHLSFTGIVTYKKSEAVQETAANYPLDKIMIETDCPYLAPQSVRGQVNEPKYVVEIAQKIADLRGISIHDLAELTTKNAERFFQI